jgi:diacylglycerol kinase family enzyme
MFRGAWESGHGGSRKWFPEQHRRSVYDESCAAEPVTMERASSGHAGTLAVRAFNVVVANCRFYGGGTQISPKSEPADGALEVLVMKGPKFGPFTPLPKVYRGTHLPHRNIAELRASRVRVEADPPLEIEADGEILGTTPATFEVIPGASASRCDRRARREGRPEYLLRRWGRADRAEDQ